MIYFCWSEQKEGHDIDFQKNCTSALLEVLIDHKEGHVPQAQVVLSRKLSQKIGAYGFLFYEQDAVQKLLFRGSFMNGSLDDGKGIIFYLTVDDKESHSQMMVEQEALKELPFFDPLFVEEACLDDLDEILEGRSLLPHWNRKGEFGLSDILESSKVQSLGTSFIHQSLKTRLVKKPLEKISMEANVQWLQEYSLLINLSPSLMESLKDPFITTLTPKPLQKHWWKSGYSLPQTAYRVAQSDLVSFDPERGGVSHRYPLLSEPFHVQDRYPVHLPRFWFVPHLLISTKYRQKRAETLRFTLTSSLQPILQGGSTLGREKKIKMRLQNVRKDLRTPLWEPGKDYSLKDIVQYDGGHYVCEETHRSSAHFFMDEDHWSMTFFDQSPLGDQASSTYFLTARGQESMLHAVERARSFLWMGSRVFETTFEIDAKEVFDIDCDTVIELQDPRLPGGRISGKVARYRFHFKADQHLAQITLLSSIGKSREEEPSYAVWKRTPSGIALGDPTDQEPKEGVLDPRNLQGSDILKRMRVIHDASDQNALLAGKIFLTLSEAETLVRQHPTRLEIDLMPLNRQKTLHHKIDLEIFNPVVPPMQVRL